MRSQRWGLVPLHVPCERQQHPDCLRNRPLSAKPPGCGTSANVPATGRPSIQVPRSGGVASASLLRAQVPLKYARAGIGAMTGSHAEVVLSVLTPTRNEAGSIDFLRRVVAGQEIEAPVEFLFVDGRSDDGTRGLLLRLAEEDPRVRVLDNPARNIPSALNIGLEAANGEFVARMDAHTAYPPDYLAVGLSRIRRGDVDWVSGAQLACGVDEGTTRIAAALHTRLGIGGATFRRQREEEYESDTGYTGIFRRAALLELGGWDPEWQINEDGELAARIRERGGRIVCVPEMSSLYVPRGSIWELARQYLRYGFYRAKTIGRHPWSMRSSHAVPPLLVICLGLAASPGRAGRALRSICAVYTLALIATAAGAARSTSDLRGVVSMPLVLMTMHLSWGIGFLLGAARFNLPAGAFRLGLGVLRA
jgi:succinoglycan biosynthesis protein ExoA